MWWDSDNSIASVSLPRKRYGLSDCAVRLVADAASAAREVAAYGTDPLPSLATRLAGVAENVKTGRLSKDLLAESGPASAVNVWV